MSDSRITTQPTDLTASTDYQPANNSQQWNIEIGRSHQLHNTFRPQAKLESDNFVNAAQDGCKEKIFGQH
ncbi:hypothetical protein [Chamaesiphon sp. GL140_3_metabinner_50]|uniref:hypothetical protein n=1 Tax=Chamaesiphon sp. GL140_3_metabinner_50 TaxID=2970812 RepID=UPI0025FFA424|nr:hypothetical protein [Chamaesiphon sp. GL140_3_metabinner_50]